MLSTKLKVKINNVEEVFSMFLMNKYTIIYRHVFRTLSQWHSSQVF